MYIFRAILILMALAYTTSATKASGTKLCLFKGHLKHDPQEVMFWVEESGNKHKMPFYLFSGLGYSDFKSINVSLKDGQNGHALLYLYHNKETVDENVAFVEYAKSAYHFSGSEKLDYEKFKVVGGAKVVIDFGSCVKPEYHWDYDVPSTEATVAGHVKRSNNYP
ncbi:uncharacterized protein V1513DRAFT_398317 [Lipomyces chichibuensis]|uniref:uncharacterized protein n=1 Tax=Lipomyces chichibuensis TaxID=1546026 RepID=UPI003343806E